MRKFSTILVTGGYGFIGSNFIRYLFEMARFDGKVVNIDSLTYAGNINNLKDIKKKYKDRYVFEHIDICDGDKIFGIFKKYNPDCIIHFAAESHVDRSILAPKTFIETNIMGTFNLLEASRILWENNDLENKLFHHISTDEVYGSLNETGYFYENTAYDPRSPYSASKASSDHIVKSYFHTYGLPITISNCSNNYGPFQFPEKLIPLMIFNILEGKNLPVYGKGENIRDWVYVDDHNSAVVKIIKEGRVGETYNIGGENELKNIDLVNILCENIAKKMGKDEYEYKKLITFVKDRKGHDLRYAINCDKIKKELNWNRNYTFEEGIDFTIGWYIQNREWVNNINSGEYKRWIRLNYAIG